MMVDHRIGKKKRISSALDEEQNKSQQRELISIDAWYRLHLYFYDAIPKTKRKKGTGPNEGMGPKERNKHRKEQKEWNYNGPKTNIKLT